ncbi:MAG TPA: hypothetical protein VFX44_02090 [Solirubrobacterales bacterium]|nr:hypothetical protein [Solirubrobacterales bacterium]
MALACLFVPECSQAAVSHGTSAHEGLGIDSRLLSVLIGIVAVVLQIPLEKAARSDKGPRLVREDLVWWIDWVIAAAIGFGVLALSRAHNHGSLSECQIGLLIATFSLGCVGLPTLVRAYGYDRSRQPPALRAMLGILVPNMVGAFILVGAVLSGAIQGG